MIKKTQRKLRRAFKAATTSRERGWPSYDLREDLRRETQKAHRRLDRISARVDRLRARYRASHDVRWLESAEKLELGRALAEYREAGQRAAILNRLLNLARRYRRPETLSRNVEAFVQRRIAKRRLTGTGAEATRAFAKALYRYTYVETSRASDASLRRAWRRVGRTVIPKDHPNAFLFAVPERPAGQPQTARKPGRGAGASKPAAGGRR